MWSPRVQSDRMMFAEHWRLKLEQTKNLDFYQEMVSGLIIENNQLIGVRTSLGLEVKAKSVVLNKRNFFKWLNPHRNKKLWWRKGRGKSFNRYHKRSD